MGCNAVALVCVLLMCHGCVSNTVREGAVLGAAAGALTGSAVGYAVSNEDIAGSPMTESGDISLDSTETVLAGLLVGAVFGTIVGGIFGHYADDPMQDQYERQQQERAKMLAEIEAQTAGSLEDEELDEPNAGETEDAEPDSIGGPGDF